MTPKEDSSPNQASPQDSFSDEELGTFQTLVDIVARLRAPGGCPWDREQTHESLKRHLLEESYEVIEAGAVERPSNAGRDQKQWHGYDENRPGYPAYAAHAFSVVIDRTEPKNREFRARRSNLS